MRALPLLVLLFGVVYAAREKRTLELVLRTVADAFGYDVQKRPSLLPLAAPPPRSTTVFPPPVKPLPRVYPVIRINPPAKPAPKAPAPKPKPPPPPKPKPAPAPAPPKVTPPPLLTENVRKTFNIAFNFNRDINTPAPPPAPPAPPKPPAPAPPKKPPPPPPPPKPRPPVIVKPAPPKKPPPPPPPKRPPPPPPPPPTRPPPPPQTTVSHKKPQLYANYPNYAEYYDQNQKQVQPAEYDYDLTNANYPVRQTDGTENNYEDSKQRFKESIEAYWRGSPYVRQNGYQFLTTSTEQPQTRYEEYELQPQQVQNEEEPEYDIFADPQPQQKHQEYYIKSTRGGNQPETYDEYQYQRNPDEEESGKHEEYVPPSANHQRNHQQVLESKPVTKKAPCLLSQAKPPPKKATTAPVKKYRKPKNTTAIDPQYAGVLPVQLHQLYSVEKNPWPPIDSEVASTAKKDSKLGFIYVPDHYEPEYSYTPPEPTPVDYAKLEKLTSFEDADKELSENARVETQQFGKSVTVVRVEKPKTKNVV